MSQCIIPLSGELALFECGHERRRQPESTETQTACLTPSSVIYQRNGSLVEVLLVVVLILYKVEIDKIAHVRARVPPNVVRIDIHLPQIPDHLILVNDTLF